MVRWTVATVLFLGLVRGLAEPPVGYDMRAAGYDMRAAGFGVRVDGTPVRELAAAGVKVVVLYFVASDCPVSNRTMPEMLRVRTEFVGAGSRDSVAFWFVYPNTGETAGTVRAHMKAFGAGLPVGSGVVLDAKGELVEMAHARVTPEAAVLVREGAGWKALYTGKIDDRYMRLGLERPQATEHYVEQVVDEVLAEKPVQAAVGVPVGCAIVNPKAPVVEMRMSGAKR